MCYWVSKVLNYFSDLQRPFTCLPAPHLRLLSWLWYPFPVTPKLFLLFSFPLLPPSNCEDRNHWATLVYLIYLLLEPWELSNTATALIKILLFSMVLIGTERKQKICGLCSLSWLPPDRSSCMESNPHPLKFVIAQGEVCPAHGEVSSIVKYIFRSL